MKKKFSKILGLALALAMVMAMLSACGGGGGGDKPADGKDSDGGSGGEGGGKGKIAYIVGNLGDKSFSDSGEAGMNILREEGWDVKTIETGDASKADKFEDYIRDALDQGYTYIVASNTYKDVMMGIADEYADARFLCFDDSEENVKSNMTHILYAQNEGSYLVGMMAAGMSKTGVVAVDVGVENPVINDFVTGYIQGVQDYDPNCKVVVSACGSWTEPTIMKSLVLDQARNNNADVFYQVAGGSGDGLFEAAMETNTWAIGVDSDQYQAYKDSENPEKADVILTSMLKEVGNSFVSFFHSVEAGEDVWGKNLTLGLKEDSVGYVDNAFFQENVPEDVRNAMADAAAKVKAGELTVKSYYDFADESEYLAFVDAAK